MPRVSLFLLLIVLTTPLARAQVGQQAFVFQKIVTDPEARALGEATVAERGILGAADLNPATIGSKGSARAGSNLVIGGDVPFRTPWIFSTSLSLAYADVKVGRWAGAYQYKHLDLGLRELRDAQNNPTGSREAHDFTHKLAASYDVTERLTAGVGLNLIRHRTAPAGTTALGKSTEMDGTSFDLGLVYTRDWSFTPARLRGGVGWSLTDFGKKVSADPLPTTMRLGGSAAAASSASLLGRPIVEAAVYGALSKAIVRARFEPDATVRTDGPWRSLLTTWQPQAIHFDPDGDPIVLGVWDQVVRHAGASASVLEILELRAGRLHEHTFNGARQYSTLGWGIDLYYVRLDRSWISSIEKGHPLERVDFWRLTARIPLTTDEGNFWRELFEAR